MNRIQFTKNLCLFTLEMIKAGERPIFNEIKRETIQQVYYFLTKLSKCDGINKRSKHQDGLACDIFFVDENGNLDWTRARYEKWHKRWEKLGGKPIIHWDLPHFEG